MQYRITPKPTDEPNTGWSMTAIGTGGGSLASADIYESSPNDDDTEPPTGYTAAVKGQGPDGVRWHKIVGKFPTFSGAVNAIRYEWAAQRRLHGYPD